MSLRDVTEHISLHKHPQEKILLNVTNQTLNGANEEEREVEEDKGIGW